MKIGKYQIGRFHGIIKKVYEDGSCDYETNFTDARDLYLSVEGLDRCVGKLVGIGTNNPKVLKQFSVIRGKEEIIKELSATKSNNINTEKMTCDNCSFCVLVEDTWDCDYGEANYYYSCGMKRNGFKQNLSYICDDFAYRKLRISEFDIDED